MHQSSFHTPKLPKPLNLDLAHLSGGGIAPSQFFGKTHDSRDVYVRYRGGFLSVQIADEPGRKAIESTAALEVAIGPLFDGSITLAQFCRYFGVSVNGVLPEEIDSDASRNCDLSGRTTFWRCYLSRVTRKTAQKLLKACGELMPDALLVKAIKDTQYRLVKLEETSVEETNDRTVWFISGAGHLNEVRSDPSDYVLPKSGQLHVQVNFDIWQGNGPRRTCIGEERAAKETGQNLITIGHKGVSETNELPYSSFQLKADFPSDNMESHGKLSQLGEMLLSLLPKTLMDRVDLKSGEVVSQLFQPLDPEIVNWCRESPDRWITVMRDGRDGPWVGVRPTET